VREPVRRGAMVVLAGAGWAIAAYLTYVHYRGISSVCFAHGACETVQSSRYAKLVGVPVATIGLVGYTIVLATLVARGELARLAGLMAVLVGWGFSAYLTYRELFTIDAICPWCVTSAAIMTLLLVLAVLRFLDPDR
jgi:uncharacterized membrane protein